MKNILKYTCVGLAIYIGIFMVWMFLGVECIKYVSNHNLSDSNCTQDSMSKMIRTTHKPLLKVMMIALEK